MQRDEAGQCMLTSIGAARPAFKARPLPSQAPRLGGLTVGRPSVACGGAR